MGRTIVITGVASGLGLEFLIRYAEDEPTSRIYGIDLQPLPDHAARPNVVFIQADITSETSIGSAISSLKQSPVDLVVHSAGIRGLIPHLEDQIPKDTAPCESLEVMTTEMMQKTFAVNTMGTFNVLRALLPNLKGAPGSKVVVMSSRMGSIDQNTSGGAYAYRASKAAQNAVLKSFSIDVPEVTFVSCHPGRVETKLVRWKEDGAISAAESVDGILPLVERWSARDSGKLYDRFGKPIPW